MTDIRPVTDDFAVAPQIALEDLPAIKAAGYATIINNRPDGEAPDQPTSDEIAAQARELGLEYRYVPVVSGGLTMEDVAAFGAALEETPKPALAYCRSGTRSCTVWALSQKGEAPADEIMERAAQAGYDLSGVRPYLERG